MVKIALIQFQSNLAVSIAGSKREDFKKGTKLVVPFSDVLMLKRLGCIVLSEKELTYKKDKKVLDSIFNESIAEAKRIETEKLEAEKLEAKRIEAEKLEAEKLANADTEKVEAPKVEETETPKVEETETEKV